MGFQYVCESLLSPARNCRGIDAGSIEEGGIKVNLLVHKSNDAAINLYGKMGFRQASIPGLDASLEEEAQKGAHQRIIMSLSLSENQESDQP